MRVLITGANGFLAANIIEELNLRGIEVKAMLRAGAKLSSLKNLDYHVFYGDLTDRTCVRNAVSNVDVVIHTAANTSQVRREYRKIYRTNYLSTYFLLEACVLAKVKKFIFISTANTIANGSKEKPGTEENSFSPLFYKSFYARSKLRAEQLVLQYSKSGLVDAVVVNPTFMLGPRDAKPSSGRLLKAFAEKKIVFITRGGKSFVHVADAAKAVCNAIDSGVNGERYLLAGENLTYKEFVYVVEKIDKIKKIQIVLPSFILRLTGIIGDILTYTGFNVSFNTININILESQNFFNPEKAIKVLKMTQTPVNITVIDALKWFKENH